MSDAERLEQLERRMAQLEEQMRVLAGQRGSEAARQPSTPALAAPPPRGPTAQPATAPPPRRPAALFFHPSNGSASAFSSPWESWR